MTQIRNGSQFRCKDCGAAVAYYIDDGWEEYPDRHLPTCGYWQEIEAEGETDG
jgi:hypothetical protein